MFFKQNYPETCCYWALVLDCVLLLGSCYWTLDPGPIRLWYWAQYWTLILGSVQAGWSLTFLHYPSRWLGTGGTVEQTAGCHSADTASQFAATRDEDEEEEE